MIRSDTPALEPTRTNAARVPSLPWHHRNPFDRLLIAQAMIEKVSIISHDKHFDAYAADRVW